VDAVHNLRKRVVGSRFKVQRFKPAPTQAGVGRPNN